MPCSVEDHNLQNHHIFLAVIPEGLMTTYGEMLLYLCSWVAVPKGTMTNRGILHPFIHPSIHLSACMSVHPYIHPSPPRDAQGASEGLRRPQEASKGIREPKRASGSLRRPNSRL